MYRFLFLPAQPTDGSPHGSGDALRQLAAAVAGLKTGRAPECRTAASTSPEEWSRLLADLRPQVVHIHSAEGASAEQLPAQLFRLWTRSLRCVILDGCATSAQAQTLSEAVDCVLSLDAALTREQRLGWTLALYEALIAGSHVERAVELAGAVVDPQHRPAVFVRPGVQLARLWLRDPLPAAMSGDIAAAPYGRPRSADGDIAARITRPASQALPSAPQPTAAAPAEPGARYLNAGFFRETSLVPAAQALDLKAGAYRLGVNVGSFWSPGERGAALPDGLLAQVFRRRSEVVLDVLVRSQEVAVEPPAQQLRVPAKEDSETIYFALTFPGPGRFNLSVDLLFHGHLLQSRSVECDVVADASVAPPSAKPQDSRVTFTRTAALASQALAELEASPRQLTIVAEREQSSSSIALRIYDSTKGELERCDTRLTDTSLVKALKVLRERLAEVMGAYQGGIGGTPAELCQHLGMLADVGRRFYRALLPDAEGETDPARRTSRFALAPGSIIQVAPLSAQLSVPWELLYERPIESYRKETTRLCPTFKEHDPAACPNQDDPQVVCPHGFWGYRYIIEQLPCRTVRSEPRTDALPMHIENHKPLELCAVVNTRLRMVEKHIAALRAMSVMNVVQVDTLAGLKTELTASPRGSDFVYFYTHGGADDFGSPYLEIGKDTRVEPNDLDAWGVRFPQRPLVFMNACDSASYSPDQFDDLIQLLCSRGAAGVIGTQCEVREMLANEFVLLFLKSFLRQVPAGRALFDVRHALLAQGDPRGLAYSLFAAAEVRLERSLL